MEASSDFGSYLNVVLIDINLVLYYLAHKLTNNNILLLISLSVGTLLLLTIARLTLLLALLLTLVLTLIAVIFIVDIVLQTWFDPGWVTFLR